MAVEFDALPFVPRRAFTVFRVPGEEVRGEHAHRRCHQLLIATAGHLRVLVDNLQDRRSVALDSPDRGLHIPPMTWGVQFGFSADAVLLVLASRPYDADDYIRDYEEFIQLKAKE
jgi:hypothetical protein